MRFASCLFVGVAVLLVASVGLTSLRQRGPGGGGAARADVVLVAGNEAAVRRLDAKSAVAQRLIDGELTLLEAAAWFRYITRTTAAAGDIPEPGEEDEPEAERFCRQVIRWAGTTARTASAERSEAIVRRLEAELDERRRDGGVELPEVP